MEGHLRAAAWLRIVWSGLGLLTILCGLLLFSSVMRPLIREAIGIVIHGQGPLGSSPSPMPDVNVDALTDLTIRSVTVVMVVILLLELPGLAAGWGLLHRRPWARSLNIAFSIFDLISIPVGTAIGAYSLWVMFHPETAALFRSPPLEPS